MRKVSIHSAKIALAITRQIEKGKDKQLLKTGDQGKSRRWCDAEVDRLIELLEERPCLWDVFCKEYHVREKRERAYEEIENELGRFCTQTA